ncbi:hypothetical protein ACHAXA_005583 [Cyclostephanos tholiformis]|uniref:Uncharacterized protein n=1 Tax=Cyclostephanos tholiformis TaxID=382380 RepID=A0ABD3SGP9_9STRA
MTLFRSLIIAATLAVGHGFGHFTRTEISRREALSNALASVAVVVSIPANAITACPPNSNNCLRQTWTPPSSASAADAIAQLRETISEYPIEGQEDGKVDGGGYAVVSDTLGSGGTGSMRVEYRSSGKGTFARLFNGGKPFVDDLVIEANGNGGFEFRSASRVGDSDFGVNGKRLSYLGGLLKGKGWSGVVVPN